MIITKVHFLPAKENTKNVEKTLNIFEKCVMIRDIMGKV